MCAAAKSDQGPTCCTSSLDSWRASASLRVSTVKALSTRSFSLDLARISPSSPVIWLDPPPPLPGAEGPPGMREATPREMRTSPPIEGAVKLFSSFRPASKYPAHNGTMTVRLALNLSSDARRLC